MTSDAISLQKWRVCSYLHFKFRFNIAKVIRTHIMSSMYILEVKCTCFFDLYGLLKVMKGLRSQKKNTTSSTNRKNACTDSAYSNLLSSFQLTTCIRLLEGSNSELFQTNFLPFLRVTSLHSQESVRLKKTKPLFTIPIGTIFNPTSKHYYYL